MHSGRMRTVRCSGRLIGVSTWGMFAQGVSAQRGLSTQWRGGGVSLRDGVTPSLPVDRQTLVKTSQLFGFLKYLFAKVFQYDSITTKTRDYVYI